MASKVKTVLVLLFSVLLFSWLLSFVHKSGFENFEEGEKELRQLNYMDSGESTRDLPREYMQNEDEILGNPPVPTKDDVHKSISDIDMVSTSSPVAVDSFIIGSSLLGGSTRSASYAPA